MNEKTITEEQVREEHLAAVNQPAHWLYFLGVLGVSFLVMVALIGALGAAGS
jgi:hypothetical protein